VIYLGKGDIEQLLDPEDLIVELERAFVALSNGEVSAPPDRDHADPDETPNGSHARNRKLPLYRVTTSNHKWLTHDPDAGFRTYKKPAGLEGWHGFYHSRAVDDFTGLTLYGHVTSSSRTELSQYTDILRGIIRSTNPADKHGGLDDNNDDYEDHHLLTAALLDADVLLPEAILGDRGLAYVSTYEQNTRLGIQTVMPWRNFNEDAQNQPTSRSPAETASPSTSTATASSTASTAADQPSALSSGVPKTKTPASTSCVSSPRRRTRPAVSSKVNRSGFHAGCLV
jgi:hypothetical protein